MLSKKLAAGLAAVAALTLPFVVAAPASAATLPVGDSLYALSCQLDFELDEEFSILYSVDPADAHATQIGDGSGLEDDCAYQAAFDPTTGFSYYISSSSALEPTRLVRIDVATGDTTVIPWTGDWEGEYPTAMAIGKDGAGYAISGDNLLSLNPATGALHGLGDLNVSDLYGFSVDPTSGLFYAISEFSPAWRIDVAAVTATYLGNVDTGSGLDKLSLQIDTSGAWWVAEAAAGPNYPTTQLWTGAAPVNEDPSVFASVGYLDDITNEFNPYSRSLLITYPKALAATGVDATVLIGAGATAALLLLMGGAVLVLRRRAA